MFTHSSYQQQPTASPKSQAQSLTGRGGSLTDIGISIATAARMAAAIHQGESARGAQNVRDQASRLRELVAAMTTSTGGVS